MAGHSPLVAYACLAAGAEEALPAAHLALDERAKASSRLTSTLGNAAAANLALIGMGQNIVAQESCTRDKAARDQSGHEVFGEPRGPQDVIKGPLFSRRPTSSPPHRVPITWPIPRYFATKQINTAT
jgi:hypothetical protein